MATHGIEYDLALVAATASLAILGGGSYSIDQYLERNFLSEPKV